MPLTDPTVLFYSQNATHLAQKYDQAADGILPLVEKFARSKDIHILDYGCGTGRDLARLHEKGYTNIVGYDPSKEMTAAGRAKYPLIADKLFDDKSSISAAAPVDLVICSAVLQHVAPADLFSFLEQLVSFLYGQVKQGSLGSSAALILSYPLQWPGAEKEARRVILHDRDTVSLNLLRLGMREVSFTSSSDSLQRDRRVWGSGVYGGPASPPIPLSTPEG